MKNSEQLARETIGADALAGVGYEQYVQWVQLGIDTARSEVQPEIYIVQNEMGEVVDVFRDADEATAAYQGGYTVTEETIWEPGEYALALQAAKEDAP